MAEISVIIPIYQSARYLRETLESLANQTYKAGQKDIFEILLIVDGECEDFRRWIPPEVEASLKVLKIPHRGVSGARNYGIEKATGQFVAFLDADDIWAPGKISKQMEAFARHPEAGMVYTNSYWIDKKGHVLKRTQKEQYGRLPSGRIERDMMERDFIITSSVLARKEVFQKTGVFDESLEVCEDWELKIRISKAYPVVSIDEPLIYYRLHAGGTHYKCARMLECGYQVFDRHAASFNANGSLARLKANVPLNLAGSWLYIDQPREARKYLRESLKINAFNRRLYLLYLLSLLPKSARDFVLTLRDHIPLLP